VQKKFGIRICTTEYSNIVSSVQVEVAERGHIAMGSVFHQSLAEMCGFEPDECTYERRKLLKADASKLLSTSSTPIIQFQLFRRHYNV
jgi:hypothetical protein